MSTLRKPTDPVQFWYLNAGRHLVEAEKRAALDRETSGSTIIRESLACGWPRIGRARADRFNRKEALVIGEGYGRIHARNIAFSPSALIHDPSSPLEVKDEGGGISDVVKDLIANPPEPPFLAIVCDRGTDYAQCLRVTETLGQIHLCSTKADSDITFSLDEMRKLIDLTALLGVPAVSKARECRAHHDRGLPDTPKLIEQLKREIAKTGAEIDIEDLVWSMPETGSGEMAVLSIWLKAQDKKETAANE